MTDHASNGGQGDGPPEPISRTEMADVRRACRQDWPVDHNIQVRTINQLAALIDPDYEHADGRRVSHRTRISAARTLGALASLSLRQQALDLERDRAAGKGRDRTLADLVDEAEAIAEEFARDRDRGTEAGEAAGPLP
jgi:hypothetical protein